MRLQRNNVFGNGCGYAYFSNIEPSQVQRFLASLRMDPRPLSAKTCNYYLAPLKSFCRWAQQDKRLHESPVNHLQPLKTHNDDKRERRPGTVEEIRQLLVVTADLPTRFGMTGLERSLLYQLAVETGLRASELHSLRCNSFDLCASCPTVKVRAAYSKRRRDDTLDIRTETAETLRAFLAGRDPDSPAFNMPDSTHTAEMLRADMKVAGIEYVDASGRVFDFHAMRHTCGTWLLAANIPVKVIQRIMRHSTMALTADTYGHTYSWR